MEVVGLSDPAILDFGNIFGGESITFWIKIQFGKCPN